MIHKLNKSDVHNIKYEPEDEFCKPSNAAERKKKKD